MCYSNKFLLFHQGVDAEEFDGCHGKVDANGRYHYKELPALECLFPGWSGQPNDILDDTYSVLVGVALDGFPIYYLNTTYFNVSLLCHLGSNITFPLPDIQYKD